MQNETTPTTNDKISRRLLALMAAGASLPEAFDAVLGEGAYVAVAGDLYDALRAKGGAR